MAEINKKKEAENTFEGKEVKRVLNTVREYKINAEANVVLSFYKDPRLLINTKLTLNDFTDNCWKVYFTIAHDIIVKESKVSLDELTIGFYLEQHPKLKEKYFEYNGYDTIVKGIGYVETGNLDSYIDDMKKWRIVLKLYKMGMMLTMKKVAEYADMRSDEIYNSLTYNINEIFSDMESGVKAHSLSEDLHGLIDALDAGAAMGLPYYGMDRLNKETGGQHLGTITLLGGVSNAGKSTVARTMTVPSIIANGEKLVVIVNEDSYQKWQREMLVWVCNNVIQYDIQKHTVRNGHFKEEVREKLTEAAIWLENKNNNNEIVILPFLQYKTSKAIQEIRKYAAGGCKYFILDTFKMDAGKVTNNSWLEMQQAMVDIKDAIKAEALNVHVLITFQLEKGSAATRFFTQNNIGMAKNIVDVASTCIMIRDLFPDECADGKSPLHVFDYCGAGSQVEEHLKSDKRYQIFFIVKNQEGAANVHQIVVEHDKSRNILKEVGFTNLSPDF